MNWIPTIVLTGTLAAWNSAMGVSSTWYVAPEGDDAAAGTGWEAPFKTISNAVAKAANADEIVVSNGVYSVTVPINISKTLTVRALSSNPRDTVIDGGGVTNCVVLSAADTLFCGFTVSNGYWNGKVYGGGIKIDNGGVVSNCVVTCCYVAKDGSSVVYGGGGVYTGNGIVTDSEISYNFVTNGCGGGVNISGIHSRLTRCRIFGNRCTGNSGMTEAGGGVYASNGTRVEACEIFDNQARKEGGGGGIGTAGNEPVVVTHCLITGNRASGDDNNKYGGGGLSIRGVGACVTDCVISNNFTNGDGGGVYLLNDGVISNCLVEGNSAMGTGGGIGSRRDQPAGLISHTIIRNNTSSNSTGGGLYLHIPKSGLTVRNCLIEKNAATQGGAAYTYGSNVLFVSCTIVNNHPDGIYLANYEAFNTTGSVVSNCLLFGNAGNSGIADVGSKFPADMENFYYCFASNNVLASHGVGNVSGDPKLENFAEGDYRLKWESPCRNAGAYAPWMTRAVDLRGSRRICGPRVDIGAYELFYLSGMVIKVR